MNRPDFFKIFKPGPKDKGDTPGADVAASSKADSQALPRISRDSAWFWNMTRNKINLASTSELGTSIINQIHLLETGVEHTDYSGGAEASGGEVGDGAVEYLSQINSLLEAMRAESGSNSLDDVLKIDHELSQGGTAPGHFLNEQLPQRLQSGLARGLVWGYENADKYTNVSYSPQRNSLDFKTGTQAQRQQTEKYEFDPRDCDSAKWFLAGVELAAITKENWTLLQNVIYALQEAIDQSKPDRISESRWNSIRPTEQALATRLLPTLKKHHDDEGLNAVLSRFNIYPVEGGEGYEILE